MIQVGDDDAFKKFDIWVQTVRMFASRTDWSYTASVLPSGHPGKWYHWQKPFVINKTLHELPEGDMLFFLDLDVAVDGAALQATTVTSLVQKGSKGARADSKAKLNHAILSQTLAGSNPDAVLFQENMTCDFMGQDGRHTLNSGAIVFRASAAGRKLANLYAERMKKELPMDQLALQSAVMSLAIPTYHEECDDLDANAANNCYDRTMRDAGYPRNKRSFEKYCILDRSRHLSMHDDDNSYSKGDVLYHGKNKNMAQSFRNSWNQ